MIRNGVSRGFLIMTAAYTTLGARSYSKRVLGYGSSLGILDGWRDTYRKERDRLNVELSEESNRILDAKWEQLFDSGLNSSEMFQLCEKQGYPILAKRIDLIEGNFRFKAGYKVNNEELLQIVYENPSDSSFLLV